VDGRRSGLSSGCARRRVPDCASLWGEPVEDIFTAPPFLCIEILSPDDAAVKVRAKLREYRAFGVA
jgi:Uma2 family endonuclease